MPRRKRAKPAQLAPRQLKSRRLARKITTSFHTLMKERSELEQGGASEAQLSELDARIESMGGRKVYQDASLVSTSFHKVSKWVFSELTRLGLRPSKGEPNLQVFEVGAINTQVRTGEQGVGQLRDWWRNMGRASLCATRFIVGARVDDTRERMMGTCCDDVVSNMLYTPGF